MKHRSMEAMMQQDAGTLEVRGADEMALRALVEQMEAGWNAHDGAAFAAPFAADADYVIVNGMHVKGREAIASGHQQIFDTIYRESTNHGTVRDLRLIRDDVALVHTEWHLQFRHEGVARQGRALSTMVMARDGGLWSIVAFQNTPIEQPGGP